MDKVDSTGHYLLDLINDILDVSKIESGKLELKPEVYYYEEFMSYIQCLAEPLCFQKNITFILDVEKNKNPIFVDKVRINQLIMNVLSNAIKYTAEGGTVTFKAFISDKTEEYLEYTNTIEDTGCGMSKEFMKKMFEPFEREEAVRGTQGTGLGLAIVKSISEKMHGDLSVESELGKGTKFTINVKVSTATQKQIEEAEERVEAFEDDKILKGRNILVAEDHALNMQIIDRLLTIKEMHVTKANDGKEVVSIFESRGENAFDAILMDVRMPQYNGLEATKLIRKSRLSYAREIPIIAMTANAFEEDRKEAREAGMTGYLTKPIEPKVLYAKLTKCVMELK